MQAVTVFMTTDRERASSSYGGHVSEISVSEDGKPSCSRLASSACMASKITLSISAPEAALTAAASVPSTNGAAHKRTFAAIPSQQFQRSFSTQ